MLFTINLVGASIMVPTLPPTSTSQPMQCVHVVGVGEKRKNKHPCGLSLKWLQF